VVVIVGWIVGRMTTLARGDENSNDEDFGEFWQVNATELVNDLVCMRNTAYGWEIRPVSTDVKVSF